MQRILLLFIVTLLCNVCLFAQNKIKGTVVDKDNQPLMGVQVKSETGDVAVTTDLDGRFEITVPEGSKLTFSMLGTKSKTKEAADGMTVVMGSGKSDSFQGMFNLNSNFTDRYGGLGADLIFGCRLKPYYHIGGGISYHSPIGPKIDGCNLVASLYFNNLFYIPTKSTVSPMFDMAVGCNFGGWWSDVAALSYKETVFGFYAKAGFGFEAGMFRMSAGYELIGTHTGYVRIGVGF